MPPSPMSRTRDRRAAMVADVLPSSFLHEETSQTSKRSHRTNLPELLGSTHSLSFVTQVLPQGIPGIALTQTPSRHRVPLHSVDHPGM